MQEPANKRARLESVIPVRTTPLPAAKAAQPAPKPVPPPLWLSGQLPANQCGTNNQEVSCAEGGAATSREEASRRPGEGSTPGSAQRRCQRRPPGPLGQVVKRECESLLLKLHFNRKCLKPEKI